MQKDTYARADAPVSRLALLLAGPRDAVKWIRACQRSQRPVDASKAGSLFMARIWRRLVGIEQHELAALAAICPGNADLDARQSIECVEPSIRQAVDRIDRVERCGIEWRALNNGI